MTEKSVGQAVDVFLDDQDDVDNTRQLNEMITQDTQHARTAFRRFLLHVLLEQHYTQQRFRRQLGMADSISEDAPPRRWFTTRWVIISMLTLVSVAVIWLSIVLAYSFFQWSARYDPVAAAAAAKQAALAAAPPPFLVTSSDTLWAPDVDVPKSIDELFGRPLILQQGLAAITYTNGNCVMLQGPANATAESGGCLKLDTGAMAMEFAAAKEQKILATRHADIFSASGILAAYSRDNQLFVRLVRGAAKITLRGSAGGAQALTPGVLVSIHDGQMENLGDEPADQKFGPALQSLLSKNAAKRPVMPAVYDGFTYAAAVTAEQQEAARQTGIEGFDGGWGWDGPWRDIGAMKAIVRSGDAEAATGRAGILAYADLGGAVLLRQGAQLSTGAARQSVTVRNLQRNAFPASFVDEKGIGATGSVVWVSFLVCSYENAGDDHYGYLQLGDGQRGVRIGKLPGEKNAWALASMRKRGEQAISDIGCGQPAYIVAQINFRSGPEHVLVWVNPEWKKQPKPAAATMQMFVPDFRLEEVSIVGYNSLDVDEIRIGTSFAAVAPFEK